MISEKQIKKNCPVGSLWKGIPNHLWEDMVSILILFNDDTRLSADELYVIEAFCVQECDNQKFLSKVVTAFRSHDFSYLERIS